MLSKDENLLVIDISLTSSSISNVLNEEALGNGISCDANRSVALLVSRRPAI
jgi:hypothetical protein